MPCPFLREGRARYCHAATVRKLILDGPGAAGGGLCASADYGRCALARPDDPPAISCPHLEEIHVQYCGASPVVKLVPFSESQTSPCTGSGFKYCGAYLTRARPHGASEPGRDVLYAPNHMWLDVEDAGLCHIGVDAFVADLAGTIDAITFSTSRGARRPAVSLSVSGVEFPLVFPNPMLIESVNLHLRSDPGRITADPYGAGWLFEGWELPGKTRSGLIAGDQAKAWLAEEREQLARAVHESQGLFADGGHPVRGIARLLPRADVVRLFQRFFAKTGWTAEE